MKGKFLNQSYCCHSMLTTFIFLRNRKIPLQQKVIPDMQTKTKAQIATRDHAKKRMATLKLDIAKKQAQKNQRERKKKKD